MAKPPIRLAVFDLDYTVWQPEMYQLWGPPKLVQAKSLNLRNLLGSYQTIREDHVLVDRSQTPITVFDGAGHALSEIQRLKQEGHDIQAAVASRTDEPAWADVCMKHLCLPDGTTTLYDCFRGFIEIDWNNDKTHHFRRLHQQTGIPYEQMCFFDNEEWNIQCVSRLGVTCIYTPDGMTRKDWREALAAHGMTDW